MALNQKEGFLDGIELDRECYEERCLNDMMDGFGDEKEALYDHEGGNSDEDYDVIVADLLSRDLADILGGLGLSTLGVTADEADVSGMFRELDFGLSNVGVKANEAEVSGMFRELDFGLNNLGVKENEAEVSGLFPELDFGLNNLGFKEDDAEVSGLFQEFDFVMTGKMRINQDAALQVLDGNGELFFKEGLDGGHALMVVKADFDMDGGDPSDALMLALGYLRLRDLLAVESVCRSLRDAVRGDPLLWKSIHIEQSFGNNITDDILIKLTNRAQGHLHSLSLYRLSEITDVGLMHVLERNPSMTKLSVPGCRRLTADGILSNLKVLKTAGKIRLKYLGIYGLFGVTNQHLEEFKLLIGVDNSKLPTTRKPRFFGGDQLQVISDDDRAVDIEVCPKCQKLELIYDCPSESCQKKHSSTQLCRGCTTCIARCINCGCCLYNCDYLLCLDCWRQPWLPREEAENDFLV